MVHAPSGYRLRWARLARRYRRRVVEVPRLNPLAWTTLIVILLAGHVLLLPIAEPPGGG